MSSHGHVLFMCAVWLVVCHFLVSLARICSVALWPLKCIRHREFDDFNYVQVHRIQ